MSKQEQSDRSGFRTRARLLQQLQTVVVDQHGHERPYLDQFVDVSYPTMLGLTSTNWSRSVKKRQWLVRKRTRWCSWPAL